MAHSRTFRLLERRLRRRKPSLGEASEGAVEAPSDPLADQAGDGEAEVHHDDSEQQDCAIEPGNRAERL